MAKYTAGVNRVAWGCGVSIVAGWNCWNHTRTWVNISYSIHGSRNASISQIVYTWGICQTICWDGIGPYCASTVRFVGVVVVEVVVDEDEDEDEDGIVWGGGGVNTPTDA
jgi:hypothetical protein